MYLSLWSSFFLLFFTWFYIISSHFVNDLFLLWEQNKKPWWCECVCKWLCPTRIPIVFLPQFLHISYCSDLNIHTYIFLTSSSFFSFFFTKVLKLMMMGNQGREKISYASFVIYLFIRKKVNLTQVKKLPEKFTHTQEYFIRNFWWWCTGQVNFFGRCTCSHYLFHHKKTIL